MNVHLVVVDNGDTEPEVWAFREPEQAVEFAALRGSGAKTIIDVPLMGYGEARQVIAQERNA